MENLSASDNSTLENDLNNVFTSGDLIKGVNSFLQTLEKLAYNQK
ncbi:MAG: hypothetical protein P0S95_07880 [Rhabdochlamydiaceae bacterium]|nr:hypothetical protein [Candidatus Amphrikana amoebophyrae]